MWGTFPKWWAKASPHPRSLKLGMPPAYGFSLHTPDII